MLNSLERWSAVPSLYGSAYSLPDRFCGWQCRCRPVYLVGGTAPITVERLSLYELSSGLSPVCGWLDQKRIKTPHTVWGPSYGTYVSRTIACDLIFTNRTEHVSTRHVARLGCCGGAAVVWRHGDTQGARLFVTCDTSIVCSFRNFAAFRPKPFKRETQTHITGTCLRHRPSSLRARCRGCSYVTRPGCCVTVTRKGRAFL